MGAEIILHSGINGVSIDTKRGPDNYTVSIRFMSGGKLSGDDHDFDTVRIPCKTKAEQDTVLSDIGQWAQFMYTTNEAEGSDDK